MSPASLALWTRPSANASRTRGREVARRMAHEIKNPLTPIQLSAERLRSKFKRLGDAEQAALGQYADVIMRQAGDIRRMVDEFSRFARMPALNGPETNGARAPSAMLCVRSTSMGSGVMVSLVPVPLPGRPGYFR